MHEKFYFCNTLDLRFCLRRRQFLVTQPLYGGYYSYTSGFSTTKLLFSILPCFVRLSNLQDTSSVKRHFILEITFSRTILQWKVSQNVNSCEAHWLFLTGPGVKLPQLLLHWTLHTCASSLHVVQRESNRQIPSAQHRTMIRKNNEMIKFLLNEQVSPAIPLQANTENGLMCPLHNTQHKRPEDSV